MTGRSALATVAFCVTQVFAQDDAADTEIRGEIVVTRVAPGGAVLQSGKIPFPVQTGSAEELTNANVLGLADFLRRSFAGVSLNDAQNNPLQPDLQYRGFTASPLLGLAQGVAVYQNGVRINEPLGDTVNWDLIPRSSIQSVTLSGGANPLFGLNSLGGSLIVDMKDGFAFEGTNLRASTGSFGRNVASIGSGGNNGGFGWYAGVDWFEEDGWRDFSGSDALNFYGSLGWRFGATQINLDYQYGDSDLTGNGATPVELLALDREAIFTGPDLTANNMNMLSLDFSHGFASGVAFSADVFHRENNTDSFNGDLSELLLCELGGEPTLLEGLEDDELETLGLDADDVCGNQFADAAVLENYLNDRATALQETGAFNLESIEADELSGTGVLSDEAINNVSEREQTTTGAAVQWTLTPELFGYNGQLVVGAGWFRGRSDFDAVVELAEIDPISRLTGNPGTGSFIDEQATAITTQTESASLYFTNTLDLYEDLALTLSLRANRTDVDLRDKSGQRPELNGSHTFTRVNPAAGLTWQMHANHNLYFSWSQSSRAPTPIELACNEGVFDLAVQYAIAAGEDGDEVDFECRLPNAFLADPPLDDVVARSFEAGSRGLVGGLRYHAGVFHTTNRDDILFQTTGRATGLFANVDKTRRQGVEARIGGEWRNLSWTASYSYVDATFEDSLSVLSPNHRFANADGEISVNRGDRIPGIPRNSFKLVTDYTFMNGLTIGLDLLSNSGQFLRGDESNELDAIGGYTSVNLRGSYRVAESVEIFAVVQNVFDREYETFGLLGENPGEADLPVIRELETPVFLGAAQPRGGFIGINLDF